MTEADRVDAMDTAAVSTDIDALIASLRAAGAARFDPVRMHYIDVLAQRASAHEGSIKRMLESRLQQALTALHDRFEQARRDAGAALEHGLQCYPQAAGELQRLFDEGDFKGMQRLIGTLKAGEQRASLGALVRLLEHTASEVADAPGKTVEPAKPVESIAAPRPELKTIRNFRKTWAQLSIDKQMSQALEQAPKNAGPINSHMLVLRSLATMRDISPDYLNHFISYADTLLSLDQGERDKLAAPKKQSSPAAKASTKTGTRATVKPAVKRRDV